MSIQSVLLAPAMIFPGASMGVNIKVVQELLGHSNISIKLGTYVHLLPSIQQEVVEKWDEEFGDGRDDVSDAGKE
jgi:integrase